MKPITSYTLIFIALSCFFISCSSDKKEDLPKDRNKRTVLVYMVGKTRDAVSGLLEKDFQELKEGYELLPNNKEFDLLVFISNDGRFQIPSLIKIEKNKLGEVVENVLEEYDPEVNATDSQFMENLMVKVFNRYKNDSYGLIMGSHADGWLPSPSISMRAFGDDNKRSINITELAKVLNSVTNRISKPLDYLLFDACLMQSVEVAYELRHATKYLIGSPAEIPGPGGPYHKMVASLFDTSANYSNKIVDSYFRHYEETYNEHQYGSNENWTSGVAISSINTTYIEGYSNLVHKILVASLSDKEEVNLNNIRYYDCRETASTYKGKSFYYDIQGVLSSIIGESNQDSLDELVNVQREMVYYKHTNKVFSAYTTNSYSLIPMSNSHGISMYVPRSDYNKMTEYYHSYEWYHIGGWKNLGW